MQIVKIPNKFSKELFKNKEKLEELKKELNVALTLDSEEGIIINGESIDEYISKKIITAIGRGFEIKTALNLKKDNLDLKIINLNDYFSSKDKIAVIKGRIIGTNGKMKKTIQTSTDSNICIFGKTVSIIGEIDKIEYAIEAIFMLINGKSHSSVFKFLEKIQHNIRKDEVINPYKKIDIIK